MALNQVGLERLGTQVSKKIGASKNLIINGAFQVAQRGTSSGSSGYKTVDRFQFQGAGLNAAVTTQQANVASGTTPYTLGFRNSYKITNGAQTGPDASDKIEFITKIEAGDIAKSGWNYKSTSSFITLSFWVKSSVAQNFFGYILSLDGTSQNFPFETGSLSADTWTKITKVIPGNSNLDFDSDATGGVNEGLRIVFQPFMGTSNTGSVSLDAWAAFNSSVRTPDQTSTWFTTDGATWEFTGVQLEVGSVATDFEHRSFGEELALCQRYYYKQSANDNQFFRGMGMADVDGNSIELNSPLPTTMRVAPSALEQTGNASDYKIRRSTTATCTSVPSFGHATKDQLQCRFTKSSHGFGDGSAVRCVSGTAGAFIAVSAEL